MMDASFIFRQQKPPAPATFSAISTLIFVSYLSLSSASYVKQHEDKCTTSPTTECWEVEKPHVEYTTERKCHRTEYQTVYDRKCDTIYNNECMTAYENKCKTVSECSTTRKRKCKTECCTVKETVHKKSVSRWMNRSARRNLMINAR